jgi:hypothetical protein
MRTAAFLVAFAAIPAMSQTAGTSQSGVSFRLDVMPVIFRAGCNSGGCHGAASGKDGFHLSLFGYDPGGDYFRITRQVPGRRIDLAKPEQSLLLLKAVGAVPHSGGRRFKPDSAYYNTLLRWIQAGAPDDSQTVPQVTGLTLSPAHFVFSGRAKQQPLQAIASYSDGSTRVVNNLALYFSNNKNAADIDDHGVVTGGKPGDTWVFARFARFTAGAEIAVLSPEPFTWRKIPEANYIDRDIDARLKNLHILPSAPAGDEEFVRRAYLDLIGLLPAPAEFEKFMADRDPQKRKALVDALLARPEFPEVWATKWAEWLKVTGGYYNRKSAYVYRAWLLAQFQANIPLDRFVRDQVASSGSNMLNPPSNLYAMLPDGRYDPKAVAEAFSQVFTGVRIQCAQCHNHPFDRWTQEDYYGLVSFFSGVKSKKGSEFRESFFYNDSSVPTAAHPLDNHPVPPHFPGGPAPQLKEGEDPRAALADWLTSKDNILFRQNMANRVWAQFFGRGIVEPIDDVRVSNPPGNSELLADMGRHLADYNFDMRRLIRDICASQTYQRSTLSNPTNSSDADQFSHQHLRRLRADTLLDSLSEITEVASEFRERPLGTRAGQLYDLADSYFLGTFGLCPRTSVNASDTRLEPTLAQSLHLIAGDTIQTKLERSPVIPKMLAEHRQPGEILDELFIRAYSRKPSAKEKDKLLTLIGGHSDKQTYDDIFWALLNSSEFEFNH